MISVSLHDFAATAKFGPIQLGTTRNEIERFLGLPEMWGPELDRDIAVLWRYADIEFYFENHILWMIFTDHNTLTNGGDTCEIDPWIIRRGLPREELEAALTAENIEFSVSRPTYDPQQRIIITAADVKFTFLDDKGPDWPDEELGLLAWNQMINPDEAIKCNELRGTE